MTPIVGKQYLILYHDDYWGGDYWDVATYYDSGFQTYTANIERDTVLEHYLLDDVIEKIRSKTDERE